MAKKNAIVEEPATEEVVNGLKEMNTETAAPVASAPAEEIPTEEPTTEETPAVEEFNPHTVGHATRAFRG